MDGRGEPAERAAPTKSLARSLALVSAMRSENKMGGVAMATAMEPRGKMLVLGATGGCGAADSVVAGDGEWGTPTQIAGAELGFQI